MITRNAVIISISVVLLIVSVALVLVSNRNIAEENGASEPSETLTQGENLTTSVCSYAPVGDYMLCCENELGEEEDCTEKTHFEANEKVTIVVNPSILQNEQAPYTLCASSDLLLSPGVFDENSEDGVEPECVGIAPQMENFVIRKDGFVPGGYPDDTLTLLQLSTAQDDDLESRETLLDITRLLAR